MSGFEQFAQTTAAPRHPGCGKDVDCNRVLDAQDEKRLEGQMGMLMLQNLLKPPAGQPGLPGLSGRSWQPAPSDQPNTATGPNADQPSPYSGGNAYQARPQFGPPGSPFELTGAATPPIDFNDPAEKMLAEAQVAMYGGTQDPTKAIEAADPKYAAAVTAAVQERQAAIDHQTSVHTNLGDQAQREAAAAAGARQKLEAAIAAAPNPQLAEQEASLYVQTIQSQPDYKGGLASDLENWHILKPLTDAVQATNNMPATAAITQADRSAAMATAIVLDAREKYGDALQAGGLDDKAWEQRRQAVTLTGRTLPEHRPQAPLPEGRIKI